MPQCVPAMSPAALNKAIPTIVIDGAMVRGVMKRKTKPTTPASSQMLN